MVALASIYDLYVHQLMLTMYSSMAGVYEQLKGFISPGKEITCVC